MLKQVAQVIRAGMANRGKKTGLEGNRVWTGHHGSQTGRLRVIYPKVFRQGVELTRRLERRSPRMMVGFFSVLFLLACIGATWILSGGKSVFAADVAGVNGNDLFYRMFLEDESRAHIAGPKGGPDSAGALKLFPYTIGKDDSLSKIAEKTGVTVDALISLNKLSDAHVIRVGQQLTIPNQKGIYHKVARGDSVERLSRRYGIQAESIQRANGLVRDELETGSVIFLPGAKLSADEMERALGMLFVRPAAGGWLSSSYGYRRDPFSLSHQFHPGIDIALPYWTPIVAVRSGQVEFSGWNGGYGKMVMLKHADGYSTIYGHMIQYIVSSGQWVRAGQRLGYVGSTGYSTGPHLHFELRRYGRLINPLQVPGFRRAFVRG